MGREQGWQRQRIFLYFACLTVFLAMVSGCQHTRHDPVPERHLDQASAKLAQRDFKGALAENEKVIGDKAQTLGDRALYQKALIAAHPENPEADYEKAVELFLKIDRQYPGSDLTTESEIWVLALSEIVRGKEEIGLLQEKMAAQGETIRKNKKSINRLKKQLETEELEISVLTRQIKTLEVQIETLKKIDLGVEKKKRRLTPGSYKETRR